MITNIHWLKTYPMSLSGCRDSPSYEGVAILFRNKMVKKQDDENKAEGVRKKIETEKEEERYLVGTC